VGPDEKIQPEAKAIPTAMTNTNASRTLPTLGRNWGETNVPTVTRKSIERINVPSGLRTPKNPQD
jgi:hypothetical protein